MNNSYCDDCGAREGEIHAPECDVWARVYIANEEGHAFTSERKINLAFTDDAGHDIGEFLYDKDAQRWTFSGNMDESAKQFAKFMYAHFQSILNGDRDGIMAAPVHVAVDPAKDQGVQAFPENAMRERADRFGRY